MTNLITTSNIARLTGRQPCNVSNSFKRGLLPAPDFTINETTPLWLPETIQPYIDQVNKERSN